MPDKVSLKALRESIDECRVCGVNFVELTTDEQDALLSIAEAARDAEPCIPNPHLDRCNCSVCAKRKHLRAALAQVEE